jgi:hypothetical protein
MNLFNRRLGIPIAREISIRRMMGTVRKELVILTYSLVSPVKRFT